MCDPWWKVKEFLSPNHAIINVPEICQKPCASGAGNTQHQRRYLLQTPVHQCHCTFFHCQSSCSQLKESQQHLCLQVCSVNYPNQAIFGSNTMPMHIVSTHTIIYLPYNLVICPILKLHSPFSEL